MRGWQALLLALPVGLLGIATGNSALEKCALALAALLLIGLLYRLLLARSVASVRAVAAAVIPWGGALAEQVTLSNNSRLRIAAVRIVDHATLPAHPRGFVAALPGGRAVTWDVRVPCRTRGRYTLGPVEITTSDPLRLFPSTRTVEPGMSVLVLPRWVPLSTCRFALDGALPGDQPGRLRGEAPPTIAGVRTYQPGDSMARIHWTASARAGTLLTKQFDPEVQTTLWLALDLDGILPGDAEELLVTAATSLGMYALQQAQLRVGLVASGAFPATLVPERGKGQQQRLQELLAEVHPGQPGVLIEQFAGLDRHISAKHVVLLLTSQAPTAWTGWLEQLAQRGLVGRVVHVPRQRPHQEPDHGSRQQPETRAEGGWPVPAVTLPLALADPARGEDLVGYLEQGEKDLRL